MRCLRVRQLRARCWSRHNTVAEIHARLLADCVQIGRFPLCHLLLSRDASYPWFILVPDREGITEIHHLSHSDQQQLIRESSQLARVLEKTFRPDKLNIAALGNIVPQLHLHHIVRYRNDPAWPAPVWGKFEAKPYSSTEANIVIESVSQFMKGKLLHEAN